MPVRGWRHLDFAATAVLVCVLAALSGSAATLTDRLSLATAWLSFVFLTGALLVGPWHTWQSGRRPVNDLLRRDFGIWAGLTGLAHLVLATGVVMTPAYFRTYISGPPESPTPGWAGWVGTFSIVAGYGVGLVFMMLMALSSNRALRWLGTPRWKRLQRCAVPAFAVVLAHGLIFQVLEGRTGLWLAALLIIGLLLLVLRWRAAPPPAGGAA